MNYVTLDTETVGLDEKFIYDLGFAIHDNNGKIFHKENYLISEVFDSSELMGMAYYKDKLPLYLEMLETNKIEKIAFSDCINILYEAVRDYEVSTFCAYNIMFDLHALLDTFNFVMYGYRKPRDENGNIIKKEKVHYDKKFFAHCQEFITTKLLYRDFDFVDIYSMACKNLLTQDEYIHLAVKNQWFTEKGNPATSAEYAYRYITKNDNFIESHTALDDSLIEVKILSECMKHFDKQNYEYIHTPYRLVKKRYKELYSEETA